MVTHQTKRRQVTGSAQPLEAWTALQATMTWIGGDSVDYSRVWHVQRPSTEAAVQQFSAAQRSARALPA